MEIRINLAPTEDFILGIENMHDYFITVTDIASKPSNWDSVWGRAFGEFGHVKFRYMMDATGFTDWELTETPTPVGDQLGYMVTVTKALIDAYNASHDEPLAEKDGTLVEV
jgi:hypothetical protein